jgi:hypothetical protein
MKLADIATRLRADWRRRGTRPEQPHAGKAH